MDDLSPIIAAFGYPCLDYIVKVEDTCLMDKFNLMYDNQCNVSDDIANTIIDEVNKNGYEAKYCAGGCAQNTLRIFQWLIGEPYKTVAFGAVGKDKEADIMKQQVENAGVVTKYEEIEEHKTTRIIIISYKNYRCAAGSVNALQTFSKFRLAECHIPIIDKTTIIHLDSFFTSFCPAVSNEIINRYIDHKIITFNMGAVFLLQNEPKHIVNFCNNCDILFGNQSEFRALTNHLGLKNDDFLELLKSYQAILTCEGSTNYNRLPNQWKKIIVITDAENPVHCVYDNNKAISYNIPILKDIYIVDTTGAGDAFIAGFLYGILFKKDITRAIEIGCRAAREIIQQYGVTIPDKSSNFIIV